MAEHHILRDPGALLPDVIKKPGGFLILHMESAVVIGMFLEKRRIVIRLHKKKVRIDTMFQKALPIVEIGHDDDLSTKPVLRA